MKKALTYKGAVMTWECDSNRHMNVMYYVNKFEHAGRNTNVELGLTDIVGKNNIGIVVVEQQIKYLREVLEDDLIYIESTFIFGSLTNPVNVCQEKRKTNASFGRFCFSFFLDHGICQRTFKFNHSWLVEKEFIYEHFVEEKLSEKIPNSTKYHRQSFCS